MRAALIATAMAIKFYIWLHVMSGKERVLFAIALSAAIALTAAIVSARSEQKTHPVELYCSDWSTDASEKPFPCEFKLRSASWASRPNEGLIAAQTI